MSMSLRSLLLGAAMTAAATAAELAPVADFGENPTNIQMFQYVPDTLGESPAIIVNVSHLEPQIMWTTRRTPSTSR